MGRWRMRWRQPGQTQHAIQGVRTSGCTGIQATTRAGQVSHGMHPTRCGVWRAHRHPLDLTGGAADQGAALGRDDGGSNRHHAGAGKPRQYPARDAPVGAEKLQHGHAGIINQAAILTAMRSLFHLAFHVTDLEVARQFYGSVLGCTEGRSTATWVDFDFFGHQLSLHLGEPFKTTRTGHVGEHLVPMPHFGVVLGLPEWQALADRLTAAGVAFVLPPQVRFAGQAGEQWTLFVLDPFGNPIEAKGFRSLEDVYAAP